MLQVISEGYFMNDFDKILQNASEEELETTKLWLFRENIRLQAEKKEIDELYSKFEVEKKQFQSEMKLLNRKIQIEKQRLQQDEQFFDKKRKILENGFRQLDSDRRKFELDKQIVENTRKYMHSQDFFTIQQNGSVRNFFNGVNSNMSLKKRYKDLMKIFHPDNMSGDNSTVLLINEEYNSLKTQFSKK